MTDEVLRYLNKADHALVVARDLMEQGHAPDILKWKNKKATC